MQDESHISDIANDIFGIQSVLTFHFFPAKRKSTEEGENIQALFEGFPDWLSLRGYYVSKKMETENLVYQITFSQLVTLEEFIYRMEDEPKLEEPFQYSRYPELVIRNEKDAYYAVHLDGDWKLARQRPKESWSFMPYIPGYAGSSSFSGVSGTGSVVGSYGLTGSAGVTGTTGPSGPSGAPGSNGVAIWGNIASTGTTGSYIPKWQSPKGSPVASPYISGPTGSSQNVIKDAWKILKSIFGDK